MTSSAVQNFRQNIVSLCDKHGITQRELARRSEVHFVTVNRIFNGVQEPTVVVAERLAEALGVTVEKIFSEPTTSRIDRRYRRR